MKRILSAFLALLLILPGYCFAGWMGGGGAASTSQAGLVQLSNSYEGTSQVKAATEKAVSDGLATKQNTGSYEASSNKVTSLSSGSTDVQYPSAKLVYDQLAGKQAAGSYEVPLTFSNSLSRATNTVTLDGDSATPGNSKYYGTDSGGTRGYYSLPASGSTYYVDPVIDVISSYPGSPTTNDRYLYTTRTVSGYGSDVTTGVTATDSTHVTGYAASQAIDNDEVTTWWNASAAVPQWIKLDFGSGVTKTICKVRIKPRLDRFADFNVAGSNNDSTYTTLYTGTHTAGSSTWQDFTFNNAIGYRYYKITCTSVGSGSPGIHELEMMEASTYTDVTTLVQYNGSGWDTVTSTEGMTTWVNSLNVRWSYNGSTWTPDIVSWSDYFRLSTKTGWAASPTGNIYTKKIGTSVFVAFYITGTSNATGVSFTLPYTSVNNVVSFGSCMNNAVDNGSALTVAGRVNLPANSATVSCYSDMNTGVWTNSGTKTVQGSFWYEAAN